jgi:hypothetical protein
VLEAIYTDRGIKASICERQAVAPVVNDVFQRHVTFGIGSIELLPIAAGIGRNERKPTKEVLVGALAYA